MVDKIQPYIRQAKVENPKIYIWHCKKRKQIKEKETKDFNVVGPWKPTFSEWLVYFCICCEFSCRCFLIYVHNFYRQNSYTCAICSYEYSHCFPDRIWLDGLITWRCFCWWDWWGFHTAGKVLKFHIGLVFLNRQSHKLVQF